MRQKLVGEPAATCGYRKSYPGWRRPLQDDKLLAEKCCFGLPSRMRSEQSDEQSAEQLQEVKHPEARITHRGICASPDTIFGSHRRVLEKLLDKLQEIRDALDDDAVFNVVGEIMPAAQIERTLRDYYAGRLGEEDLEERLLRGV